MKNNNAAVIRRLTFRTVRADKKRDVFVVAAIALTTVLLATAFSIGMSMMETMELQRVRMAGSVADAYLSDPSEEQIARLRQLDYIDQVGVGVRVGGVNGRDRQTVGNISLTLVYVDAVQWEEINAPAFSDIVGTYPAGEDEIMLSRWTLEHIGIDRPEIGMTVPLRCAIGSDGLAEGQERAFTLSGYFTNYYYASSGGADFALVSQALADKSGCTAASSGTANIRFRDGVGRPLERLEEDITLLPGQELTAMSEGGTAGRRGSGLLPVLFAAGIFALCGFLLVYNTMLISLARDTRYYGQLKTIGMTPRQIRRVVVGAVMVLCAIGAPLGLAVAAVVSRAIVPAVAAANGAFTGAVVSRSPVIYLGAAGFAGATAFLAAFYPARKVARMSPVEGLRYEETVGRLPRWAAGGGAGKCARMAARSVFRGGKRCVLVLTSLGLSIVTLILAATVVTSIDTDRYAESLLGCDIRLENAATEEHVGVDIFSDALLDTVRSLPGLADMRTVTAAHCMLAQGDEQSGLTSKVITIYGVDGQTIAALGGQYGQSVDIPAFERGEFAVVGAIEPEQWSRIGTLEWEFVSGVTELGRVFRLPVGAAFPSELGQQITGQRTTLQIFVSSDYLRSIADALQIYRIDLDLEPGRDEAAFLLLRELVRGDNNISLQSRYELRQSIKRSVAVLSVLGGGVSLVLGVIGLLNYINVMAVGVLARRRELAVLECVGMVRSQVRKMLLLEGVGYWAMSLVLGNLLGNGAMAALYAKLLAPLEYTAFHYPILPCAAFYAVSLGVCAAVPLAVYSSMSRATVSDRLRQAE